MNNPLILSKKIENVFLSDHNEIDQKNILSVATTAMQLVANEDLKGHEKKKLVIESIQLLISTLPLSDDAKNFILNLFNTGADALIEDLYAVYRGDFEFKRSKKKFCPCI